MLRRVAFVAALSATIVSLPKLLPAQPVSEVSTQSGTQAERARSIDATRSVLEAYWKTHDPKYVAENAVFVMMPTGQEIRGRAAIAHHLDEFYHKSFDARAEVVNSVFGEGKGLLEAMVVGTHTGDFGGVPATGRNVRVPISVSYEVENGLITKARIYLMANVLFDQIASKAAAATR